ncbi:autotransporter outer membrane beta-barrel domain-containing protein [Snodgrassella gandavensis]|uniref:autotransporter outer membrane beta-barrel domain-containing protein n=1 Tax=Snodgrassella gandavensis TaxID=2946698 RepID=UPI001EF52591|nr:autotransporter outer membrane beta-barrel domain-containing protein [Snodgrassella gandavensis]
MNKIYKLIWNRKKQAYTVTSELVRKRGKVTGIKLAVAIGAAMLSSNMAYAKCSSCIESSAIFENQIIPAAIITLADAPEQPEQPDNSKNSAAVVIENNSPNGQTYATTGKLVGPVGIEAINTSDTGAISISVANEVVGETGAGIHTSGIAGATNVITLQNGAIVSGGSGIAIQDDDTNANVTLDDGSKVIGAIKLGKGSDMLTINQGADISQMTAIDGGEGESDIDILNIHGTLKGSSVSSGSEGNTAILNWDNINVKKQGKLTLTGDLKTAKLVIENEGTLDLSPSPVLLKAIAPIQETTISGNVENAGTISLSSNHRAGDLLIIDGDYTGNNGTLELDTVLGDSTSTTDRLSITGNATGTTSVTVHNDGGLGADTGDTDGINIINVQGTSDDKAFSLAGGHVDAGAFEYRLLKGDSDGEGNDWYLRSRVVDATSSKSKALYRKEVPLYAAVGAQLRQADSTMLGNMHQRLGNSAQSDSRMSWGRVIATRADIQQNGATDARSEGDYTGLQLGSDIWQHNGWNVGGYVGYLHGDLDVDGFANGVNGSVGKNATKSYFLGAYGNYTHNNGAYVDLVLQGARHNVDIKPDGNANSKQKGHGVTASVEAGKPFSVGNSAWKLEPQAQISHQWLDLDDSNISGNTTVKQGHDDAWLFRVGARMEGNYQTGKGTVRPHARVNLFYSPNGTDHTTFTTRNASTTLHSGGGHTSTEVAVGGSYDVNDNVSVYGEVGHTWSNGGDTKVKAPVSGSVGLKVLW